MGCGPRVARKKGSMGIVRAAQERKKSFWSRLSCVARLIVESRHMTWRD
jgi:hypothetical protein